ALGRGGALLRSARRSPISAGSSATVAENGNPERAEIVGSGSAPPASVYGHTCPPQVSRTRRAVGQQNPQPSRRPRPAPRPRVENRSPATSGVAELAWESPLELPPVAVAPCARGEAPRRRPTSSNPRLNDAAASDSEGANDLHVCGMVIDSRSRSGPPATVHPSSRPLMP